MSFNSGLGALCPAQALGLSDRLGGFGRHTMLAWPGCKTFAQRCRRGARTQPGSYFVSPSVCACKLGHWANFVLARCAGAGVAVQSHMLFDSRARALSTTCGRRDGVAACRAGRSRLLGGLRRICAQSAHWERVLARNRVEADAWLAIVVFAKVVAGLSKPVGNIAMQLMQCAACFVSAALCAPPCERQASRRPAAYLLVGGWLN